MDVIELSSDGEQSDHSIDNLINKYTTTTSYEPKPSLTQTTQENVVYLSDSEDELPPISIFQKINQEHSSKTTHGEVLTLNIDNRENMELNLNLNLPKPILKKRSLSPPPSEPENSESVTKKLDKGQEKLKLLQEKATNKLMKETQKVFKPGECLKYITVHIDDELTKDTLGFDIKESVTQKGIETKIVSQLIPKTISWTRSVKALIQSDSMPCLQTNQKEEPFIVLVFLCSEIVQLIAKKEIISRLTAIKNILIGKTLLLAVYGMQNYFKFWKNRNTSQSKQQKNERLYGTLPKVSVTEFEFQLTDLQVILGVSHRMVDTAEELTGFIYHITKSVAEFPYKTERKQHEVEVGFFRNNKKNCVRVDKDGNGLRRLWQQQLTQFSLVRLETADAIIEKYGSPQDLIQAYKKCSPEEGKLLLQDIPVRRGAGVLTSFRKIGPELSKRIYTFFTASNGDTRLPKNKVLTNK